MYITSTSSYEFQYLCHIFSIIYYPNKSNSCFPLAEEKPGVDNDETSSQEVSSTTTDIKETPSVVETEKAPSVADTKESDGHGEVQEIENKESLTNNEENKEDKASFS